MECNICGSKAVTKTEIDGVLVDACKSCAKFGKETRRVILVDKKPSQIIMPELDYMLKEDFATILKNNREKKGLSQEQIAKLIGEKASVIKKIEEGWEPPLTTVKKLEKIIGIRLMEAPPEATCKKTDKKIVTIGDIVEIK